MSAPIGATVTIAPYDCWGDGIGPEPGDYLLSQGGSAYLVVQAHETRRRGRYRLVCQKVAPAAVPPDATAFSLVWSRRDRRRPR